MSDIASEDEVAKFLEDLGNLVRLGYLIFVPRQKNRRGMAELGLNDETATEIVADLTLGEYHKGPVPDESGAVGDIWVFRSEHEGTAVYIKLKITEDRWAKCLSFHPAERALTCPYHKS